MRSLARSPLALSILFALACSSTSTTPDSGTSVAPDAADAPKIADAAADLPMGKDSQGAPDLGPDSKTSYLTDPTGGRITSLEIQGRSLYWISGTHRIMKASLDDATVRTLYTATGKDTGYIAIADIAVDGSNVYYAYDGDGDYANRGVYQLPAEGGSPVKLAASPNPNVTYPDAIAVSGDDICYSESSTIKHVKTSGGAVTTMISGRGDPYDKRLLLKQGHVYFTLAAGSMGRDEVYRWPVGKPAAATVDGGTSADGGVAAGPEKVSIVPGNYNILFGNRIDQGYLYWAVNDTVYRTDGVGAATEVFTAGTPLRPSDTGIGNCLFPYDGVVYWGISSQLYKQPVGVAGNGTVVANVNPSDMVADESYFYLTNGSDIVRLPR